MQARLSWCQQLCQPRAKNRSKPSADTCHVLQVELLLGDPTKARTELGWNPQKTSLQQLVEEMVDADLDMAKDPSAYLRY